MTFGAETPEDEAHRQLDHYVEVGGTLIDTADVYSDNGSEKIVGRWIGSKPPSFLETLVVATKGRFQSARGPNGRGLSRKHLDQALNASLQRLGVETIDLYQLHSYDPLTPIEETLTFVSDAIRAGKVRYLGLSNFTAWQLQQAIDTATFRQLPAPVTLQPQYNLLAREIEWEIVPCCQAAGLGLLPWSPLGGGWLTGKYIRDEPPSGPTRLGEDPERGVEAFGRRNPRQQTWDVLAVLKQVANGRTVSTAQVALAWLVDRPTVTSVILGTRTLEQLKENLAAAEIHLSEEETEAIDAVSAPYTADYPYGGPGTQQRSRRVADPAS
jgi:aryl-alcohol dehydrogenase-like predicted oxidoreductase